MIRKFEKHCKMQHDKFSNCLIIYYKQVLIQCVVSLHLATLLTEDCKFKSLLGFSGKYSIYVLSESEELRVCAKWCALAAILKRMASKNSLLTMSFLRYMIHCTKIISTDKLN